MISAAWVSRERASQAEERARAKAPRQEGPTGGGRKEGQGRESERGGCYWHPAAGRESKNATKHPMTCSPHSKEFSGPKC